MAVEEQDDDWVEPEQAGSQGSAAGNDARAAPVSTAQPMPVAALQPSHTCLRIYSPEQASMPSYEHCTSGLLTAVG